MRSHRRLSPARAGLLVLLVAFAAGCSTNTPVIVPTAGPDPAVASLAGTAAAAARLAASAAARAETAISQAESAQALAAAAATAAARVPTAAPSPTAARVPTAAPSPAAKATLDLRSALGVVAQDPAGVSLQVFPIGRTTVSTASGVRSLTDVYTVELVLSEPVTGTLQLFYNQDGRLAKAGTPTIWKAFATSAALALDSQSQLGPAAAPVVVREEVNRPIAVAKGFDQRPINLLLNVRQLVGRIESQYGPIRPTLIVHEPANPSGALQSYDLLVVFDLRGAPAPGDLYRAWCAQCVQGLCVLVC